MPEKAIELNYEQLTAEQLCKIGMIAFQMQIVRDKTKVKFGKRFKGLRITAGLRQFAWEEMRGRSGNSQHVQGWAVDVQPICDESDYCEIFDWIFEEFKDWHGGFAKAEYNLTSNPKRYGFIHFDLRGFNVRWTY